MFTKDQITEIAEKHLNGSALYLTDIKISSDNKISLFIDGDNGVTIKDCVNLSRAVEGALDREKFDFSLDVSSHGAASPLTMPRQYPKHIGRTLELKLNDGTKAEGILTGCNENEIDIEFTVRENKPIGKGKINVIKTLKIGYNEIKESKIKLKF